ncbi:MAG TPA: hypothetical protein VGD78_04790 [Chthoniobacterales bacterium]
MMRPRPFSFDIVRGHLLKLLLTVALGVAPGAMRATDASDDDPLTAWATVQQTVKDMATAVQAKHLHGVHAPSMKIRPAIRTLKAHSAMLTGPKSEMFGASLKHLDNAVTDLHSAADEGSQQQAETALQGLERALDGLKAQDPEAAFKNMH